jgi:Na+-driven multidrug efflux pump
MSYVQSNKFSLRNLFLLTKQAIKGEQQDYTTGSIRKAVFMLSIPMILEMMMESVFAVVDIFFVGRLGKEATSTVGLTESVMTMVYSIAIGLSMAATAMVARRVGEKDHENASKSAAQAMLLSFIITILISVSGIYFATDILRLMGAPADVIAVGSSYTSIMFGGSIVIILLFLINGIFRGAGDASIAMRSLWSNAIALDREHLQYHFMPYTYLRYRPLGRLWFTWCCIGYYYRQGHWRHIPVISSIQRQTHYKNTARTFHS